MASSIIIVVVMHILTLFFSTLLFIEKEWYRSRTLFFILFVPCVPRFGINIFMERLLLRALDRDPPPYRGEGVRARKQQENEQLICFVWQK